MRKLLLLLLLLAPAVSFAQSPLPNWQNFCSVGGVKPKTQGIASSYPFIASYPHCVITVYTHGTTSPLPQLYADADGLTPLANPFTASDNSWFQFYTAAGRYDVQESDCTPTTCNLTTPFTWPDVQLNIGGGGGGTPCGTTYDVQLNIGGIFGCDTGIFIEFPTTHIAQDNIFSANNQLNVSDATTTGAVQIGFSNGSVVTGTFTQSLSSGFAGTYGIDWPDSTPTEAGLALVTDGSGPGGDGRWKTKWLGAGQVSLENLQYIFTDTPCNSPSTCADLAPKPVPYLPSTALMGPPQNAGTLGYVSNTAIVEDHSGLSTATVTLPNPYGSPNGSSTNDTLVVQITTDGGGSMSNPTDTCGNTWTAIYNTGGQGDWYVANPVKCTTADVISINMGASGGFLIEAGEVINGGVLDTSVQGGSCSGSSPYTITYNSLTTSVPAILVVLEQQQGIAGGPYGTYSPASGYSVEAQAAHYGGGGLGASRSMTITWSGTAGASAGSHAASSIFTLGSGGTSCGVAKSYTLAFRPIVSTLPGDPTPRVPRKTDLEQSGDFPPTASGNAGQPLVVDPTGTKYVLGSTSVGTVITTGSPASPEMTCFSGSASITNCNLSGDATTSNTSAVTVGKVNGVTYPATPSTNTVPVVTGSNTVTYEALPNAANATPGTFQAGFPAIATTQIASSIVSNSMTFPANFGSVGGIASAVKCGTNPSGSVTFTLADVTTSTTLGTVIVSSSCVGTFATTGGTTQAVSANDYLTFTSGTDASALNVIFNLRATRN